MQVGETRQRAKSPEKRGENTAKRKRAKDAAPQICEDRLNAKQVDIESEASRQFRISQLEMEEAVKAKVQITSCVRVVVLRKCPDWRRLRTDSCDLHDGANGRSCRKAANSSSANQFSTIS